MTGLAYIGKVMALTPIADAERVEQATVVCGSGGKWLGVVGKDQFQVGNACEVYLQDALLPAEERFAFMAHDKYRVRMRRFRGAPSECLVMPVVHDSIGTIIGTDITELTGVTRYEKPLPANISGEIAGNFPSFIPKTDEPNFQVVPELLAALHLKAWVATQKADGTSTTAFRYKGEFGVCSRNYQLRETAANAHWQITNRYGLKERLTDGYAVQWETVGPGIQGNPLGLKEIDARVFNVYDIAGHVYLDHDDARHVARGLGLPLVAEVTSGNFFDESADELRLLAEGTYPNGRQQEGIVVRPLRETRVGNMRLSFKVLNLLYKDRD